MSALIYISLFEHARKLALHARIIQMDEMPEEEPKTEEQLESLQEALETEKRRAENYLTQLKYARADLENLKNRCDREIDEVKKHCTERIVTDLLDVADELELAIQSARSSESSEALVQGVEMTLKKLKKILENEGVSPMKCVGELFDPSKHSAVAKTEEEGVDGCRIVEEVRKGYTMREKVIRPSIVKVVVQPSQSKKRR
jgi:molecular chaperone GrpE